MRRRREFKLAAALVLALMTGAACSSSSCPCTADGIDDRVDAQRQPDASDDAVDLSRHPGDILPDEPTLIDVTDLQADAAELTDQSEGWADTPDQTGDPGQEVADQADTWDAYAENEVLEEIACTPQCEDAMCGDDGCGGECGVCPTDQVCADGKCLLPACLEILEFPDPNFELLIRETVGKPEGDLVFADVAGLTELWMTHAEIESIIGIECLVNLVSVRLDFNLISDLSPLTGLTLKELFLGDNIIEDLSPLSSLTTLSALTLKYNLFSDVTPLAGLTDLVYLDLEANPISDISSLAGLTALSILVVSFTEITDVSALAGLTNLITLDIAACQINDISGLAGLTELKTLWLGENLVEDVTPLSELTNMYLLYLNDNQITDVSPLSDMTQLLGLYLQGNDISIIDGLSNMTGLAYVDLAANQLTDISALAGLTGLQSLTLTENQIPDITPLSTLTGLVHLDLASNQVSDLTALQNLPSLFMLNLSLNQILDLSVIVTSLWLDAGDWVDITYNPLSCSDQSENMQTIVETGAFLQTDCSIN